MRTKTIQRTITFKAPPRKVYAMWYRQADKITVFKLAGMRQVHFLLWVVGACLHLVVFTALVFGPTWAQTQSSVDCRLIAYLPPMATFGAPVTVTPANTEPGLAFGGYGEILSSPCIHAGGEDWVVRFRRGQRESLLCATGLRMVSV